MSDAYKNVKAGRLTFKGGDLAPVKAIDKKKHKKKNKKAAAEVDENPTDGAPASGEDAAAASGGGVYTIDAAKRMKYEELFPVETKKFGYDPANKSRTGARSVEEALDDRVRKKADRYCK
ncbi:uncharacterized protein LOC103724269 [Phoenix dactylifera]|uniref:Uncharacterized protein LOC103724269 n=1 Tax=Phoenix dactylifera TaxID=42345 RepID=A0A8B8ZZH3_PHODC|nr:uncharacterized protein LOC103724269 [Phoenix dactylifera]XP_038976958.1 uncharacterized protein LOC103724269 [Phoenix dactylifera]